MARAKTPAESLFADCVKSAKAHAGGDRGFALLGVNLQHALVGTEILRLLKQHSRTIDADKLVPVIGELYDMLIDQFETEGY